MQQVGSILYKIRSRVRQVVYHIRFRAPKAHICTYKVQFARSLWNILARSKRFYTYLLCRSQMSVIEIIEFAFTVPIDYLVGFSHKTVFLHLYSACSVISRHLLITARSDTCASYNQRYH